ncbi:MAG: tRNA epoxyqueuosine(34) reductase QueG [Bradymonadaceae bacterium]
MSISERILEKSTELGFERAAIVPAAELPHAEAYEEWLREGRHGEMLYMENYRELRIDPKVLEPGTRSCLVLLKTYRSGSDELDGGLRIARYAHGADYHDVLRARMLELAAYIHAETGADVATRPAVDTAPLLERDLALVAGLGWVGKNAMLINPEIGSYAFIAEILIDLDLEATHTPVPDRCGTCSRCIDACPTGAIISPYIIDARRCISYLTIELRGPIPRELRPLIGNHLFGCDICQAVCPWNTKAPLTEDEAFQARPSYRTLTPLDVLQLDHEGYVQHFKKSAIKRAKHRGLLRNAAVVVGNSGDTGAIPVLAERLENEPDPLVRGHIAWALGRLGGLKGLKDAAGREEDVYVRDEIDDAICQASL